MADAPPAAPSRPSVPFPVVLVLLLALGLLLGRVIWPGWRRQRLVADLADPAARTRAALQLEAMQGDAVPALLDALADPTWPGRGEALALLGRARDARALEAVLAIDDPELAHERLVALGRIKGEAALEAVLAALRGEDVALHFPALLALVDWTDAPSERLVPAVEPYLQHEEWGLREIAAKFMGARRHGPAVPRLIALLRDDEASVRQMSAWALRQIGDPAGAAAVDSALLTGAVTPEEN